MGICLKICSISYEDNAYIILRVLQLHEGGLMRSQDEATES